MHGLVMLGCAWRLKCALLASGSLSAVHPTGRLPSSRKAALKPAGFCLKGRISSNLPVRSNSSHAIDHTASGSTARLHCNLASAVLQGGSGTSTPMRSSSPPSYGAQPLPDGAALKVHPRVLQHAHSQPQVVGASTLSLAEPEEVSPDSVVSHLDLLAAVTRAGVLEESSEGEGQPSPCGSSGAGTAVSAFAGSGLSGCLKFRARSRKQPASVNARVKPRLGTLVSAAPSSLLHPSQYKCHPLHCAATRASPYLLQLSSGLQSRVRFAVLCLQSCVSVSRTGGVMCAGATSTDSDGGRAPACLRSL